MAPGSDDAPRLTRRFAVYTALVLIAAAAGTFWFVRRDAIRQAEATARTHTLFVARSILREQLRPADLARPATGSRRQVLDRLFRREVLGSGSLRAKLYDQRGRVVYSTDHELIGTTSPEPETIEDALRGRPVGDVTRLNEEGGHGPDRKVLEAYVPVSAVGGAPGVFEIYADYGPIARAARETFLPVAAVIAGALLLLYLSLFPILHGVTARLRRQMRHIEHQAYHDGLTGLANRARFRERALAVFAERGRHGRQVAVMVMDLDHFKEINDALGHQSGDELLRLVARKLESALGPDDLVARLGGDEFGILATDLATPEEAMELAERLRQRLLEAHVVAGVELMVDASVGVALFPSQSDDVETLLRHADVAMYASKAGHAPRLYTAEDDHCSQERLTLISQLRRGPVNREFVVHYQPQADLQTGGVGSVEALVRWQHPERGLLAPVEFIPLAEHTGLIRDLTTYVLEEALAQCRRWRDQDVDLTVAVNITDRELLDLRFPGEVAQLLARYGLEAGRLELEITENTVLTDPTRAGSVLRSLTDLGVRVAIDDFGTGNASLSHLKRLPVDVLKIDRSFVMNMLDDDDDDAIVRSTVELGHNLGLEVVAEGVESLEAWQRLADAGCDTAQGYYLSRPVPPEEIVALALGARVTA